MKYRLYHITLVCWLLWLTYNQVSVLTKLRPVVHALDNRLEEYIKISNTNTLYFYDRLNPTNTIHAN